jgi:hypothetical protein
VAVVVELVVAVVELAAAVALVLVVATTKINTI